MTDSVVAHDVSWASEFAREASVVAMALGESHSVIHHIGSTAVPGILAKPIIDMLAEATSLEAIDRAEPRLAQLGYEAMGEYGIEGRRYFRKNDAMGRRTHHLHIYEAGSPQVRRHLAFRDFLRAHPEKAAAYSAVKAAITAGRHGRGEPYARAKAEFVAALDDEASAWALAR